MEIRSTAIVTIIILLTVEVGLEFVDHLRRSGFDDTTHKVVDLDASKVECAVWMYLENYAFTTSNSLNLCYRLMH